MELIVCPICLNRVPYESAKIHDHNPPLPTANTATVVQRCPASGESLDTVQRWQREEQRKSLSTYTPRASHGEPHV